MFKHTFREVDTMKKSIFIFVLLSFFISCNHSKKILHDNKLQVYTTIYPLYFFAKEIGGEKATVIQIMPTGADPHGFEPSAKTVAKVINSNIFIFNGLGIEPWANTVVSNLNKDKTLFIQASDFVNLIKQGNSFDPHIWLDLENAIKIAEGIKNTYIKADKTNRKYYEKNCEILVKQLKLLDEKYKKNLKNVKSKNIVTAHAAFRYLAKRYGLTQIPISGIDSHSEPSSAYMVKLVNFIKENNIKVIFVEPATSKKLATVIAKEADVETMVLNPLGTLTREEVNANKNYLSVMEENLQTLTKGLNK
jgi:zinc transport system substrate-binding protein